MAFYLQYKDATEEKKTSDRFPNSRHKSCGRFNMGPMGSGVVLVPWIKVWPADVCRGVATDLLVGVMNHRQCGQHTLKIPKNRKKANLQHFILESEDVFHPNIFQCVRRVSPPPSCDAPGCGKCWVKEGMFIAIIDHVV